MTNRSRVIRIHVCFAAAIVLACSAILGIEQSTKAKAEERETICSRFRLDCSQHGEKWAEGNEPTWLKVLVWYKFGTFQRKEKLEGYDWEYLQDVVRGWVFITDEERDQIRVSLIGTGENEIELSLPGHRKGYLYVQGFAKLVVVGGEGGAATTNQLCPSPWLKTMRTERSR